MYIILWNNYYFRCFDRFGIQSYSTKKEDARQFDTKKEAQCFARTMLRGKHKIIRVTA